MLSDPHPFADLIDEVLRTQARLFTATSEFGAEQGLTGAQLLVLTAVVRGGRPPTVPQIARSLGHSRQAVQRLADALVALGMVDTIDNPDHKRARLLVPTRRGREAYEAADAVSRTWADEVAAGLDPADLAAATRTLREIRNRLEAGTAPR